MRVLTIAESLRVATGTLLGHSESPRLDAELLLCKVSGLSRSGLIVHAADPIVAADVDAYGHLVARRARGEPIAYLSGSREFWSLSLEITADVLVPRPDTECLVERALELLPAGSSSSVVDLGTGSGAIALAIAAERPGARIVGVDVSAGALAVARRNARTLGLTHIEWRLGSWFDALPGERFDLIVANPPYIAAHDSALEALRAEPLLALTPGPSGLEALTEIVGAAAAHLQPRGWLLLEHGSTQGHDVARLLESRGFESIRLHLDYSGKPRVTLATVHSST